RARWRCASGLFIGSDDWIFEASGRPAHADIRSAAATDVDLSARRGALHVVAEVVAELVGADVDDRLGHISVGSGAEGIRTPDLCRATAALCQLSYSPEEILLGEV